MAPEVAGSPYSILSEHTSGVRCLKFSADSRWLCSIGDIHDGFIFLWSISTKTGVPSLFLSNKCTSFVHDMTWMGNSIITVGTRHVKVWKPDLTTTSSPSKGKARFDLNESNAPTSPSSKTLGGRNTLLGTMLDATFTCVVSISDSVALLSSDRGDICVLDDTDGSQRLSRVMKVQHGIKSMAVDCAKEVIWIGGSNAEMLRLPFQAARSMNNLKAEDNRIITKPALTSSPLAFGIVGEKVLMVDSEHDIRFFDFLEENQQLLIEASAMRLRSHTNAVLGVNVTFTQESEAAGFFTWDSTGTAIFWSMEGRYQSSLRVPLDQLPAFEDNEVNELKVMRAIVGGSSFISGDKYGILRSVTILR